MKPPLVIVPFFLLLIFICANCSYSQSENRKYNDFQWVTWDSLSTREQQEVAAFWNEFLLSINTNDKDAVIELIQFPPGTEWSYFLEVKKPERDLTKDDLKSVYELIFSSLVQQQLMEQKVDEIDFKLNAKGELISFLVGTSLNTEEEEFESSRLFSFCKTPQGLKLCIIFHAG